MYFHLTLVIIQVMASFLVPKEKNGKKKTLIKQMSLAHILLPIVFYFCELGGKEESFS